MLAFLGEELADLAAFHSYLIQYAQQITPYIDNRSRELAALTRRITEDSTVASAGVAAGLEAVASAQRALDDSFDLLDASMRVVKREIHRLRDESPARRDPDGGAAPGAAASRLPPGESDAGAGEASHAGAGEVSRAGAGEVSHASAGEASHAGIEEASHAGAEEASHAGAGEVSDAGAEEVTRAGAGEEEEASVYVAFEDAFRGAPGDIAERQRTYLRYFEGAADVLDVGCGRGEFLELLRERGVPARGIDTNPEMVARCVERGLSVTRADAVGHLAALPEGSLGGIFSAQVVEHLEAAQLVRLLEAMHRALRPGGRAVVETINPTSWVAFFSAYLRDVTHRHPLHPDTLQYLLRAAGFRDVEIVYRSPPPAAARLERVAVDAELAATPAGAAVCRLAAALNRNADRLNDLIFADQDYAAIATRRA